jgi:hypothetical protein
MSGESLQRTLDTAFAVVGNAAGFKFKQYRPDSYIQPFQDRNLIGNIKIAASPDDAFTKNPHDDLEKFKLYASSKAIEVGDILYSEYLNRTYIVFDKTELRCCIGIRCQDSIDVLRPILLAGDKKTGFEIVASGIPGVASVKSTKYTMGAMLAVPKGIHDAGATEMEVWTWVTPNLVHLNDVLQIGDVKYLVIQVDSTTKGTKLLARATKVGT